jgi:hypothetical protein
MPPNSVCRYEVLDSMAPWMGGGEMIQDVFLDHSTYAEPPGRSTLPRCRPCLESLRPDLGGVGGTDEESLKSVATT